MKKPDRMTLELCPLYGSSYTQLTLSGPVPSAPQKMRRLLAMFSLWSGYPVDVVLFVDEQSAGWCDLWIDALGSVPAHQLEVRFQGVGSPDEEGRR